MPEDSEIAAALGQPKLPATAQSSTAAYRPLVEQWLAQGVTGVVIHSTLKREHGFSGHYSSGAAKRKILNQKHLATELENSPSLKIR